MSAVLDTYYARQPSRSIEMDESLEIDVPVGTNSAFPDFPFESVDHLVRKGMVIRDIVETWTRAPAIANSIGDYLTSEAVQMSPVGLSILQWDSVKTPNQVQPLVSNIVRVIRDLDDEIGRPVALRGVQNLRDVLALVGQENPEIEVSADSVDYFMQALSGNTWRLAPSVSVDDSGQVVATWQIDNDTAVSIRFSGSGNHSIAWVASDRRLPGSKAVGGGSASIVTLFNCIPEPIRNVLVA